MPCFCLFFKCPFFCDKVSISAAAGLRKWMVCLFLEAGKEGRAKVSYREGWGGRDEEKINLHSFAASGQKHSETQSNKTESITKNKTVSSFRGILQGLDDGLQTEMRPRSKLPSKRSLLLPTIREGTEETVRELNDANMFYNSVHKRPVSSEDYFLSICHLAHPTFPTRDMSPHYSNRTQDSNGEVLLGCHGHSDPLEHLYGHPNNLLCGGHNGRSFIRSSDRMWDTRIRAHSIPNSSSPNLAHQRKSSCPELHTSSSQNGCLSRLGPKIDIAAVKEEEEERQDPGIKASLITQWISDCRSAWREARARACLLPAIAEI